VFRQGFQEYLEKNINLLKIFFQGCFEIKEGGQK
jgi:hypothetical protein